MLYNGIAYGVRDRTDYGNKYMEYVWQHHMFELTPEPPRLDGWQDYFIRCKEENAKTWFSFFLHHYEPRLNDIVSGIVMRYSLRDQFADIKTVYATALWQELQRYDIKSKIPFLTCSIRGVWRELHTYIRENVRPFTGISEHRDKLLRRIAYDYDKLNRESGKDEAIRRIAEKLNMSNESVYGYIAEADANLKFVPFFKPDDNGYGDDEPYGGDDVTRDITPTPEEQVIFAEMSDRLFDAFYSLDYADRVILAGRCGFCEQCLAICKPLPFEELATMFEMSGAGGAEKRYARAVEKMKKLYNSLFITD